MGATAVGKTAMAIQLAKALQTEIISADARQFYKEMEIGTAKPSLEELASVKHHLINSHSISQTYNVGEYEKDVLNILEKIFETKNTAILVGGSGLYIQTICDGIDEMPEIDENIRENLTQRLESEGLESLVKQLQNLDPIFCQNADLKNPHRVIRALEICLGTGKMYSSFRKNEKIKRPFFITKIGLEMPREMLYNRIDTRMDTMLAQGLEEEVKNLIAFQEHNALQTVGYQEVFSHLKGEYDRAEMIRLLKRNSRRYAKRQLTWFRRDTEINWFSYNNFEEILHFINDNQTYKVSETL